MRVAKALLLPLALMVAAPAAMAAPLLVAVVPDLPGSTSGDEGFGVGCAGPATCILDGHTVGDGESTWTFPAGTTLAAGATLWVVGNATRWAEADGPTPFLVAAGGNRNVVRLGNEKDELSLRDPAGTELDAMSYGEGHDFDPPASAGLVLQRHIGPEGWVDTDSAEDWRTPRMHRIGESALDRPTFSVERITAYSSPDSSFGVLTGLVAGARERLHLHVYELRNAALADALVAAKAATPRLDLQVLVDGNPVGQSQDERHATADALRRIEAVGGRAVLSGNGRYDDHHLKVLVADAAVAVQSENWVPSGVPQEPSWGNRGWGVVLHDAEAATWFAAWMAADRDAWESVEFDLASYDPTFREPVRVVPRTGEHAPVVPAAVLHGPFRVTPAVAPDHTADPAEDAVAAAAAGARRRLDVQQLDLSLTGRNGLGWTGGDPLADALATAASRGAEVRVQAAAPFAADDTGNADALAWLSARGVHGEVFDRPGISALHNKGFVADGTVVVGSMNGNLHSRAQNREVALIIEGEAVADWFAALFEADWTGGAPPRDWDVPGKDLQALPSAPWPILFVLLGLVATRYRRWT